ncbi:MAG: adenylyltransferase/cytidyltransferase family protein [Alphaproteobacteria bacterium]|nr:adenylyltransferase/cytidyltransferase family protein [Alphaproteobacteria bacterium]
MFKYQHGICIIRCQPFHIGHDRLIKKMLEECQYATVVIGSAQESGTEKNPLPYFTRKKMIQNVYRSKEEYNRLRILGVKDVINASWANYVLEAIKKDQPSLPSIDIIYVGDINEYQVFKDIVPNVGLCSRTTQDFPFLSGNMVRDMIMLHDERYKQYVHPENIKLIEKSFYEDVLS